MNSRPFFVGLAMGAALALSISAAAAQPATPPPPTRYLVVDYIARVESLEFRVGAIETAIAPDPPQPAPAPEPPQPTATPEAEALIAPTVSPIPLPGATLTP